MLKTTDEKEVKQALLERTHSLLIETETFLTHNSFSTLEGGFKLAINGIYVYKVWAIDQSNLCILKLSNNYYYLQDKSMFVPIG